MIIDKKIHILHIVSGDLWAGAEVQLFTLAKKLKDNPLTRISVVILNYGRLEQQLRQIGIEVIVLDESELNGFKILIQLIRIIHALRPDVIHSHRNKENILGSIGALINGNIPCLRTAHGAPEHIAAWHNLPKRLIYFLDWICGRFLQRKIIAVSEDLVTMLKKDYPLEKIQVIENGVDLDAIDKYVANSCLKPVTEMDALKIGIAGRLVQVKRVDVFIKTARYILDHCSGLKIKFYIFGDGPLRNELEQLSHDLKTEASVVFEGHCDNMLEKIRAIDVLLLTSDHEGLPMILLESMALGTPVIAHAVGGVPNLLDQGTCGILVNEQAASAYAHAINDYATDNQKKSNVIKEAANRVEEKYSAKSNAQAYYTQYLSML
ncbi:MAG: glycosyltransferase [Gammaproteobacteria bacterium]|nr:glycosyltransferase [Gammaproteobacteria bacterium]